MAYGQHVEVMIGTSDEITDMHKTRNELVTDILSALVLEGTGPLIFHETSNPTGSVLWLHHDIIATQLNKLHSGLLKPAGMKITEKYTQA
jgi:hypothetical protein